MIDINDYEIFKNNTSSMKQTSKDDANNEYMTECTKQVVNFDKVVKNYCGNAGISSVDSNDALIVSTDDNTVTFIEFKNGYIDKKTQYELLKKIYDSMLVFTDITNESVSSTRQFLNYILVYNGEKNPDKANPKTEYRESKSRDEIDKTLLGYAKETHIKYGLEFLKGYCFKEVNTYTKSEFEELLVSSL